MGFTLAEITSLIALQARRSCRATRELAATKLRLVDARIRELRELRKELAGLIAATATRTRRTPGVRSSSASPHDPSSPFGQVASRFLSRLG
jgi:MerR, DNA binding